MFAFLAVSIALVSPGTVKPVPECANVSVRTDATVEVLDRRWNADRDRIVFDTTGGRIVWDGIALHNHTHAHVFAIGEDCANR